MDTIMPIETMPVLNFQTTPAEDSLKPKTNEFSTDTKVVMTSKNPNSKKAKPLRETPKMKMKQDHPTASEMAQESIKSWKMRKGATTEATREYIMGKLKTSISNQAKDGFKPKIKDFSTDTKVAITSKKPNSKKAKLLKEAPKMKKKPNHPPASEMVLESIKSLKMRKGASAEAIREYIMGKFKLGTKSMRPYINRFLRSGVERGILERVSGEGVDGRFKIKKPESNKKDKQMMKPNRMAMKIKLKS